MTKNFDEIIEISDPMLLTEKPVVSVLMITHNHDQFLGQAIEGVVSQVANFPIELIIGEDCSKDKTRQIALDYQNKYPEIIRVVYSEKNVGANRNFQRVLSLCRGEYLAICEGDDYWTDLYKLDKQFNFLSKNPEYVVTFHDAYYIDEQGNSLSDSKLSEKGKRNYSSEELTAYSFLPTLTMCFLNVIRELPEEFFKVVNGDTFLISLLGNHGNAKYLGDIKPAAYRVHAGGIWSEKSYHEKTKETIVTKYWLSVYYNRINRLDIASNYAFSAMSNILSVVQIQNFLFIKWFLINNFRSLHRIYSNIKGKLSIRVKA